MVARKAAAARGTTMKPEPKRAPRVAGTTPGHPPPPEPTTPFESWVVAPLEGNYRIRDAAQWRKGLLVRSKLL